MNRNRIDKKEENKNTNQKSFLQDTCDLNYLILSYLFSDSFLYYFFLNNLYFFFLILKRERNHAIF